MGPIRTCIGCRERHPKRELLRLVTRFDADLSQWVVAPDLQASAPGRGAHLHPTQECLELAKRRRAFDRALRHDAQVRGGPLSLAVLDQYFAH
ncbi:MAG: YlxR family protein [Nocardioidaceae bacterium]|nr:YlxR family protein [Nocardioidaceae bacterium]